MVDNTVNNGIKWGRMNTCGCKHRSWPELRDALAEQRAWREGLDRLPAATAVGCLAVEARSLRASLAPVAQRATEALKGALVAVARGACRERLAALRTLGAGLRMRPNSPQQLPAYQARTERAQIGT